MVGFTNRGRARHGRGCRLLGKTTMFFNDFPRFLEFQRQRTVPNREVRAELFEKCRLFCGVFAGRL
jgi:hypothetical protein